MKILHTVEFYYPSVGGAQEVVRQLSERMAAAGHDVTLATTKLPERRQKTINGVAIAEFDVRGNAVRGYEGEDIERYKQFLIESDFDVVMNYAAQEWAADLFFEVMDKVRAKKVFVPCGFSALYDPSYSNYFQKMPEVLKKYDATVYLAEQYRDIDFAREHKVSNIQIIPNAADETEFETLDEAASEEFRRRHRIKKLMVLTVGNHTNEKGHREAIEAFRRAVVTDATLVIQGGGRSGEGCYDYCRRQTLLSRLMARFTGKSIAVLNLPREDVVQALKAADIFIFLSNIEASPLVLFESAAAGTPFITGTAGNSAEIAEWTGAGVVVDSEPASNGRVSPSTEQAARELERLGGDKSLRDRLGSKGRQNWQKRFTWEKITGEYLKLYEDLLAKG